MTINPTHRSERPTRTPRTPHTADTVAAPDETVLRRAGLRELRDLLRDRQGRKADAVVPASAITSRHGVIHVAGLVEPQLAVDGVTPAGDAALRPTHGADAQIADRLKIPGAYLRRLAAEAPEVYDANVNGLLARQGQRRYLVRSLVDGPDQVPATAPASLAELDTRPGILRALLSDSFRMIDDLDVLLAALDGIRRSGRQVDIRSCDLTENRMYVTIACPEVAAMAPALLGNYRSPFTGNTGAENPLVFAGFVITNSEVGSGRFSLIPRLEVQVCTNGMTITRDAVSEVHLGGKLEDGPVRWSTETTTRAGELITAKTRDAVETFLSPRYLERQLEVITAEAGAPVTDATGTIEHVTGELRYTSAQADAILEDFLAAGDRTAGGVMQAITSAAQRQPNAETAHGMEADGLRAMALAARHQPA